MSDSAKKPLDPKFEEKTAIMTNPSLHNPVPELNLDDDIVDENFSFDQKTVVAMNSSPSLNLPPPLSKNPSLPPPLAPPIASAEMPNVPEMPTASLTPVDGVTGSFKISKPKMMVPPPTIQVALEDLDGKTTTTAPIPAASSPVPPSAPSMAPPPSVPAAAPATKGPKEITRGAVRLPPPEVAPGDELEFEKRRLRKAQGQRSQLEMPAFLENLWQNKRALVGVAAVLVIAMGFGLWKSQQPKNIDLHLDETTSQSSVMHESAPPPSGPQMPTAEQVAGRFETVFQKVQADTGDVSR